MAEDEVVFVGNKPVMNYVLAVVTQFNSGARDVRIMAKRAGYLQGGGCGRGVKVQISAGCEGDGNSDLHRDPGDRPGRDQCIGD